MASKSIEQLEKQLARYEADIRRLKALQRERQRKIETRAKIILGGLALERANKSDQEKESLRQLIIDHIEKSNDRKTLIQLGLVTEDDFNSVDKTVSTATDKQQSLDEGETDDAKVSSQKPANKKQRTQKTKKASRRVKPKNSTQERSNA